MNKRKFGALIAVWFVCPVMGQSDRFPFLLSSIAHSEEATEDNDRRKHLLHRDARKGVSPDDPSEIRIAGSNATDRQAHQKEFFAVCGPEDETQDVMDYVPNDSDAPSKAFVDRVSRYTAQIRWLPNLKSRTGITSPGTVSGVLWCTGTLISRRYILTAAHCFSKNPGPKWIVPKTGKGAKQRPLEPEELARLMRVDFGHVAVNGSRKVVVENIAMAKPPPVITTKDPHGLRRSERAYIGDVRSENEEWESRVVTVDPSSHSTKTFAAAGLKTGGWSEYVSGGYVKKVRKSECYPVVALHEGGEWSPDNGTLDYAIIEIGTRLKACDDEANATGAGGDWPGDDRIAKFSASRARLESIKKLTLIQHPVGRPKKVESGIKVEPSKDLRQILYSDIDTRGGSSGSGILDRDGIVVGVHTNGGCDAQDDRPHGGEESANKGVSLHAILSDAKSKIIRSLVDRNGDSNPVLQRR